MMSETNPESAGKNIPRTHDIEGAPFHIGAEVKVEDLTDPHTLYYLLEEKKLDLCRDELHDKLFEELIGSTGHLKHYDYDCGCGQEYPHQPMIGVLMNSGMFKGQTIEFWKEELTCTKA